MIQQSQDIGHAPLAIGGVGGSGTRLVAQIAQQVGYDLGCDLNHANDNLRFTALFSRADWFAQMPPDHKIAETITLFLKLSHQAYSAPLSASERADLEQLCAYWQSADPEAIQTTALTEALSPDGLALSQASNWGWKEPNTHIFLPHLADQIPGLRYIHVLRDGLNMAFSPNQQQATNWASFILGEPQPHSHQRSLDYWITANQRAIEIGQTQLGARFHLVRYQQLCLGEGGALEALLAFLGFDASASEFTSFLRPGQINRGHDALGRHFTPEQLAAVAKLMR